MLTPVRISAMLTSMNFKKALLGIALAASTAAGLTGCSTSSPSHRSLTWLNTDRGSVQCLVDEVSSGQVTSCDWATLRTGIPAQDAPHVDGRYIITAKGHIYCLVNDIRGGEQYDCDWSGIKN